MVLNPIKRIKLHKEYKQFYKRMDALDTVINELKEKFEKSKDIQEKEYLFNLETKYTLEHTDLLRKSTDILNLLYGRLKWACRIFLQNISYNERRYVYDWNI